MPFRSNNPITRDELLSRFFPQYHPVTTFNSGLSGGSFLIEHQGQRFVVRQPHDPDAPQSAFLRQYRALSQLPACIAPKPHLYLRDWMVVDYLPGAVKTYLPDTNELAGLLYYLHQQPRFGWRITLLPLLELYWQQSDPARRTVGWLRMLKRLRKAREPRPLRLSPLHMDVHAGNLVHSASGLKLIDWEYAGMNDGMWDVADVSIEAGYGHAEDAQMLAAYLGREPESADWKHLLASKLYVDYLWTLWAKTRVPFDGQSMEDWAAERYARLKNNIAEFRRI